MLGSQPLDASSLFLDPRTADASHSAMARGLLGSKILEIAGEIRELKASGREVCNLTVGDFDPHQFPPPPQLVAGVEAALRAGHTNYPPSDGMPELRQAVARYYAAELGVRYPVESVLIASGARPILYGAYGTVLDPGDKVVYQVPSWNSSYYVHLRGAHGVPLTVQREHGFFLTPEAVAPHLRDARLLVVNSPLNPTGTVIDPAQLAALAELVVAENRRRQGTGQKALFLLFDQVYWTLTFGAARHVTPMQLVPACTPYVILLDAISKSFAATGLRVGWAVAPPPLMARMRDFLGHVGAWAPRAEQVATAKLLDAEPERRGWQQAFRAQIEQRLDALHRGLLAMARDGLPVEPIEPQGAIYLSVRLGLVGSRFATNEELRRHLLEAAGTAVVPFQAFGLREDSGWFRMSIGAVSLRDIETMLPRLRRALA
ncbi:MAG: aminotransferase class I/II-fold pyridoxal phosphate-dependent enzyme [Planctomycetes bacterium]|nr:aminotransferase class I/II-fold pyridoxal phosphate-dependent enzyme [Planctomycetota bacterium]